MNPTETLATIEIVLTRVSHPGNIGSAARAMKTMGLSYLTLVAPKILPNDESRALASGADEVLDAARVVKTLDEALAETHWSLAVSARARDLGPPPQLAREGAAEAFARAARGEKVALVFGHEATGLSNAELQRCSAVARIPAQPGFASLNLAAAVQVLAYELRMAALARADASGLAAESGIVTPFASPPASHAETEGFFQHLEAVMIASGFLDPGAPRRILPKLRRLFARAGLEKDEINILRGFLSAASAAKGDIPYK
ncbi:MAG: RNA methyltransferase [Zoogloeaceae bacterium]|jgi:tRNA/rRNA methyltransferase|nr:RNA methyltransferase [Zoogloeaceae bacterium]